MRVAVRAYENPSLDIALTQAKALGVPCFVYHAISQRYRYASDRVHTFMLEGARDVQRALGARGIGYAFHLQNEHDHSPHLLELAKRAALIVTDAMPLQPLMKWDEQVGAVAPLWRVDASCNAPMWLTEKPFERAFEFTKAMQPLWAARVTAPWVDVEPHHARFVPPDVAFKTLDLASENLAALVAQCDIDHSIGPVHGTPGGTAAGLERWRGFVETKIDSYASDRDDPLRQGSSRMSAYLHFGFVSPFQLAREATARRTKGADKYLNELLTWRELAWNFCRFNQNLDSVEALPAWARETLKAHERDRRDFLPSWEQLARAQTGHPLWDAAQRSLLTHGELHNNVRMTWGKALLGLTRTAQEALTLLLDLNHRFALDGRDPGSYSGILWCLGAFDRPFIEQPIFGTVRTRPAAEYSKRFDAVEYARRMRLPSRGAPLIVAVVGAGVAGAAAARTLSDAGHSVTLFDKGLNPGGRVSTRHDGDFKFDDGAQYFTVSDERFARVARSWWHERAIAEWSPRLMAAPPLEKTRLVAVPGMSALLQRMLYGQVVKYGTTVEAVTRIDGRWKLASTGQEALGEFDAVVLAAPAPKTAQLLDPASFTLASRIREARYAPCWALMVVFDEPLDFEFDAAFVKVGPIKWLARDSSKPERAPGERWVIHATPEFSEKHLEDAPEAVTAALLDALFATTGARRITPVHLKAHRWRSAMVTKPLGEPCVFDEELRIVACGDWCLGGKIESAYLSGCAAGGRLNGIAPCEGNEPSEPHDPSAVQMRLI